MKVCKDEKILLIRYSNLKGINCMEEHIKKLNNNKFVWFGKIGGALNKNFLRFVEEKDSAKNNYLMLVSKNESYLCEYSEFKKNLDEISGIPDYYYENFIQQDVKFSIFFKITKIVEIDRKVLNDFVVVSSMNNLLNALRYSMSAHFFIKSKKDLEF
ncbi:hypothetical protein QTH09_11290 [Clostridium perfringens]|nr:hypothetical protein [Clostridium perfringens]